MTAERPTVDDPRPLAGIVVADLSRVLAGPYATMLLADMGARVIKIESPSGDDTRAWLPPKRGGEATYFLSVDRNKQSIALDFSDPDDLDIVRQIVSRADVVIENFKPGTLRRFGLDYDTLSIEQPELVYASITGFGSHAGADLPGYDLIAQAVSGLMDLTGSADGGPTKVGVALVDVVTGLHAAVGILGALQARTRTGIGDRIEVNLLSSILSALVNQTSACVAGDVVPRRMGNAHPSLYPYEPFPTADRDLVIAVGNDGQFAHLSTDRRFATMAARNTHRGELRALLVERLATRGADDWFDALRAAQVPSGPILGVDGGIALAEQLGLSPVVQAGDARRGVPTVRHPVDYRRAPLTYTQAPPSLDGDRADVLRWLDGDTVASDRSA